MTSRRSQKRTPLGAVILAIDHVNAALAADGQRPGVDFGSTFLSPGLRRRKE